MARPTWATTVDWQSLAACRGADTNLFFTPFHLETKDERVRREAKAKAICAECPVIMQCRRFALDVREPHGIWGGLNEIERRHLLSRKAG
ncbi:MAG TPA: WhiB family transcriptional regulator [Actinomycetota bacterium]